MKIFVSQEPWCFIAFEQIMAISSVYSYVDFCMYLCTVTPTYVLFFIDGVLQAVRGRDKLV